MEIGASERDVLKEVAQVLSEALRDDPSVREVYTFGSQGLPGVRMNKMNGQSCFLVVATDSSSVGTTSEPPNGDSKEGAFLALVREAIRVKQPEVIARMDTILEQMMPVGLAFTTSDGHQFNTRVFCTSTTTAFRSTPYRPEGGGLSI